MQGHNTQLTQFCNNNKFKMIKNNWNYKVQAIFSFPSTFKKD